MWSWPRMRRWSRRFTLTIYSWIFILSPMMFFMMMRSSLWSSVIISIMVLVIIFIFDSITLSSSSRRWRWFFSSRAAFMMVMVMFAIMVFLLISVFIMIIIVIFRFMVAMNFLIWLKGTPIFSWSCFIIRILTYFIITMMIVSLINTTWLSSMWRPWSRFCHP